ncbi:carbamoyltransferase HypF [Wukongibacter baidiensis]|uniref:carbamoyltransferase HypF n=1 Tax=Wukongibacter baidiensis TaxID=1723361 RepID=UPI003D7F4F0A
MRKLSRKYVVVEGIVQGVGFRPFVYNIAIRNDLKGWVKNTSEGVFIDIEGEERSISSFLEELEDKAPPLSQIERITVEDRDLKHYDDFVIEKSKDNQNAITLISPDVATCRDCEEDIKDKNNRRHKYPFTNCTNCGPRFSIIKKLPYDRPMTTMKDFEMCRECNEEYENPMNRRFHAQPNACGDCGPRVWLTDSCGNEIDMEEPIVEAIKLIKEGRIIGIKGLGGFHLVCDGMNHKAIETLRNRKARPAKPLALMIRDIETVKKICYLSGMEEDILTGIRKPILLLDKKVSSLPDNIAPNNNKLGVMLPYTPLHYLLFDNELDVLVMTSANVSGLPIVYKNDEAVEKLKGIVDNFLLHDREIHIPVDDSVAKVVLDKECLIRRSRGYAPVPVKIAGIEDTLACGSSLKNTFCISKRESAFLSQHMGDIDNIETYENFEENIKHFKTIYQVEPKLIAHDMHPDFLSTEFAEQKTAEKFPIQHHHAHIASCMVDNELSEKVIGLAFDGTGLGTDGKIWGGEFLVCDLTEFERVGHLDYVKMPGGDAAVKEPWRMAVSFLYKVYEEGIDKDILNHIENKKIKNVMSMIKHNINCPETSSMGRFFDAVSGLLGLKTRITFEGEAAIYLEAVADKKEVGKYNYHIENLDEKYVVNTGEIIKSLLKDIENNLGKGIISRRFHNTVIAFSIDMCKLIRSKTNINSVALSGGVFQNEIILKGIYEGLVGEGFSVYTHGQIPCNDGGIAIGQLVIANNQFKRRSN